METTHSQDARSTKRLSPVEFQKWLKFGRRGYEHCQQTLERLCDFDKAVFDPQLDMFFKDHRARVDYIRERKQYFPAKQTKVVAKRRKVEHA